jgi:alkaline phosphatase/alkaline phosphatase D
MSRKRRIFFFMIILLVVFGLIILFRGLTVTAAVIRDVRVPSRRPEAALVKATAAESHYQGEMCGELRHDSIILQARLCVDGTVRFGDVTGKTGIAFFALSESRDLSEPLLSPWLSALPEDDFIVKYKAEDLDPGTIYFYRLFSGQSRDSLKAGPLGTFRTPVGSGGSGGDGSGGDGGAGGAGNRDLGDGGGAGNRDLGDGGAGGAGNRAGGDGGNRGDGGDEAGNRDLGDGGNRGDGGRGEAISFTAVTGMNRFAFRAGIIPERNIGFPALEAMYDLQPDFIVATGDNVYYDTPYFVRAWDLSSMRRKWHRQFATDRFRKLFLQIPVYWMKDDHDHRYNDSDPYGDFPPSHELGIRVFREQVPVVPPDDTRAETYRTVRVNDLLQLWFLEGRDYRDANTMPPGPEKSMWGRRQKEWLKRTLLNSDAVFKIIVSPTPLIGPDEELTGVQGGILSSLFGGAPVGQEGDKRKRDNHCNSYGFRNEGQAFFTWLQKEGFLEKNLFLICGDRHWQYHSIAPNGFEEFSTGAIIDRNSRLGIKPGTPDSTDPEGLIRQVYSQEEKSGGFLHVWVGIAPDTQIPRAVFTFFDERGELLYQVVRSDVDSS